MELIEEIDAQGNIVLNLSRTIREAVRKRVVAEESESSDDDTVRESSEDTVKEGESSLWKKASVLYDRNRLTDRELARILKSPEEHVQFIFQNRKFKLVPMGTMEAVPKKVLEGEKGGLYYVKSWDKFGQPLPAGQETKVYLKQYQVDQCMTGKSDRTKGLAGFVDGECVSQPKPKREKAMREPAEIKQRRN